MEQLARRVSSSPERLDRGIGGRPPLVAIDGKSIRRSFEHAWNTSGMAHLVSAFVGDNQMVMGQSRDEKMLDNVGPDATLF